ncbi:MAG: dienelactone hydrolase family protein [Gemmatimonadota bacterium]|nr:dienelactone hydrolase family protein [Gemmatimonadota bacterium]
MRKRMRIVRAAALIAALAGLPALTGCAPDGTAGESAREAAGDADGNGAAASTASSQDAGIPPAILGRAAAPAGEDVHYVPGDEATTGYLAVPEGEGPFPSVILIHEWNGLVDRVRQVADALAGEGYVALAADLYAGRTGSSRDENVALMQEAQADPDAIIANLDAAQRFLRERPDVSGRIGTIGWCFGGGVALSYAIGGENHDGTAIFYGRLVTDPELLSSVDHPIYGTFAEMDSGIPPAEVERFTAALREAGIENDIHIYDDVQHGFWLWVDRDPETNADPARDAWDRLRAYLGRVLG